VLLLLLVLSIYFYFFVFGNLSIFSFEVDKAVVFLLCLVFVLMVANLVLILFIKKKDFLLANLLTVISYYFLNNLFQQVISFGILQKGIEFLQISPIWAIVITTCLFSLAHLLSIQEGFSKKDVFLIFSFSIPFGLLFASLSFLYSSIIPGFLIHFSLYILINGPIYYFTGFPSFLGPKPSK